MHQTSFSKSTILFLFYFLNLITGYSRDIDSLKIELSNAAKNVEKARILNQLATELKLSDPEISCQYAQEALSIATKENLLNEMAQAYYRIGYYLDCKGRKDTAFILYNHALEIYTRQKDRINIGKIYNVMSCSYRDMNEIDKSKEYIQKAISILSITKAYGEMANAVSNLGNIYLSADNYDSALVCFRKALYYDSLSTDSVNMAITINNIGGAYYYKGNYAKAIDYYLTALTIFEKFSIDKGVSRMLNNIGNIYFEQKDYIKSLEYYERSVAIKKILNDKSALAHTYNSIAVIKFEMDQEKEAYGLFTKAIHLFKESAEDHGLSKAYIYLGRIELKSGNIEKAQQFIDLAMGISSRLGEKNAIAECYLYQGNILTLKKKYVRAVSFLEKADKLAKEINKLELEKNVQKGFADCYCAWGNYEKAVRYLEEYIVLNDSLFNIENRKIVFDLATKYETEKKELELQMALKDQELKSVLLRKQQILQRSILIGAILMMIILLMIFNKAIQRILAKNKAL